CGLHSRFMVRAKTTFGGDHPAWRHGSGTHEDTPPGGAGRGVVGGSKSIAVGLAAARPDEGEAFVLVFEEVGVNRGVETRIVELDREIVAALAGGLRPGGTDLGAADKHAVAGSVVVGPVGFGNDAHALGLDTEGDDIALILRIDLLERADV